MDAAAESALLRELNSHTPIRPRNWQGPLARGGPKAPAPASRSTASRTATEAAPAPKPVHAKRPSIWPLFEQAVGGGDTGRRVAMLMQRHLLTHVEGLSVDEIELMAGGAPRR